MESSAVTDRRHSHFNRNALCSYRIKDGMEIPFEVEWVSEPEQGAVAARILEPREFTLTQAATIAGCPIRDVEPGDRDDLFAFLLENESEVVRFSRGQLIGLRI